MSKARLPPRQSSYYIWKEEVRSILVTTRLGPVPCPVVKKDDVSCVYVRAEHSYPKVLTASCAVPRQYLKYS